MRPSIGRTFRTVLRPALGRLLGIARWFGRSSFSPRRPAGCRVGGSSVRSAYLTLPQALRTDVGPMLPTWARARVRLRAEPRLPRSESDAGPRPGTGLTAVGGEFAWPVAPAPLPG